MNSDIHLDLVSGLDMVTMSSVKHVKMEICISVVSSGAFASTLGTGGASNINVPNQSAMHFSSDSSLMSMRKAAW